MSYNIKVTATDVTIAPDNAIGNITAEAFITAEVDSVNKMFTVKVKEIVVTYDKVYNSAPDIIMALSNRTYTPGDLQWIRLANNDIHKWQVVTAGKKYKLTGIDQPSPGHSNSAMVRTYSALSDGSWPPVWFKFTAGVKDFSMAWYESRGDISAQLQYQFGKIDLVAPRITSFNLRNTPTTEGDIEYYYHTDSLCDQNQIRVNNGSFTSVPNYDTKSRMGWGTVKSVPLRSSNKLEVKVRKASNHMTATGALPVDTALPTISEHSISIYDPSKIKIQHSSNYACYWKLSGEGIAERDLATTQAGESLYSIESVPKSKHEFTLTCIRCDNPNLSTSVTLPAVDLTPINITQADVTYISPDVIKLSVKTDKKCTLTFYNGTTSKRIGEITNPGQLTEFEISGMNEYNGDVKVYANRVTSDGSASVIQTEKTITVDMRLPRVSIDSWLYSGHQCINAQFRSDLSASITYNDNEQRTVELEPNKSRLLYNIDVGSNSAYIFEFFRLPRNTYPDTFKTSVRIALNQTTVTPRIQPVTVNDISDEAVELRVIVQRNSSPENSDIGKVYVSSVMDGSKEITGWEATSQNSTEDSSICFKVSKLPKGTYVTIQITAVNIRNLKESTDSVTVRIPGCGWYVYHNKAWREVLPHVFNSYGLPLEVDTHIRCIEDNMWMDKNGQVKESGLNDE